jgi:hypothetical protein
MKSFTGANFSLSVRFFPNSALASEKICWQGFEDDEAKLEVHSLRIFMNYSK